MKKSFKFTAKKVEQAINEGLLALGVAMDEVEVNIISTGGLFKKAEIEIIMDVPEPVAADVSAAKSTRQAAAPTTSAKKGNNAPSKKDNNRRGGNLPSEKVQHAHVAADTQAAKPKKLFEKFADAPSHDAKPAFATKYSKETGESFADALENYLPNSIEDKFPSSGDSLKNFNKKPNRHGKKGDRGNGNALHARENHRRERDDSIPRPERKQRDKAEITPAHIERGTDFLTGLLALTEFDSGVTSETNEGITYKLAADSPILIGKHGDVLDALQYITAQVVNKGEEGYVPVTVDVLGYREKRAETLKKLAQKMADKCLSQNRRVGLEPMSNFDRRVIHTFLDQIDGVVTKSQGFDPNRRIVIYPERK